MKVAVVGCGNVGFAYLAWLDRRGFDVLGYDISQTVQKQIANTIGENKVAHALGDVSSCDSIHICVPTEPATDGSADMSIYEGVIHDLALLLSDHRARSVIQRSTCPPESADKYAKRFNDNISYGVNPSFLRKASIARDTEFPERIAVGAKGLAAEHLLEIYRNIKGPRYITESRTSVELLKYVENAIDAMLISFWNEILEYAISLDLKAEEVFRMIERICDREKFRTVSRVPGKAFGLWCLPKDLNALISEMVKKGVNQNVMKGILDTNIYFEEHAGIGMTAAQELWEMSGGPCSKFSVKA